MRSFVCCPLHDIRLRDRCSRCAEHVAYDLGKSKVHGPINCPTCAAPQLPVTRGGYPITGAMPTKAGITITRWLAFLQRRSADPVLLKGMIGADKGALSAVRRESIRAIRPASSARNPVAALRMRWSDDAEHQGLAMRYWQQVNAQWRQCCTLSRRWYRRMLKGDVAQPAPTAQILAFVYWRMTWQGCTNPYLLRRGHRLPLYGVAEWEAGQPSLDEDNLGYCQLAETPRRQNSCRVT